MNALGLTPDYDTIRAPEIGLRRSSIAWRHRRERFFAGDATLNCAVIRLKAARWATATYLAATKTHAERCAAIDALLQEQPHFQTLMETLIAPAGS